MADNYELQLANCEQLFLKYDQRVIIRRLSLDSDADYIYIDFLGRRCRIDRLSGAVAYADTGERLGFGGAMTIYDYLCRDAPLPRPSGRKSPINALQRSHQGVGDGSFYARYTNKFNSDHEGFAAACLSLGAVPYPRGDAAFTFTVFKGLELTVQLWYSDDEFPANLTLLWDEHLLQVMMYETAWYAAGYLLEKISERM